MILNASRSPAYRRVIIFTTVILLSLVTCFTITIRSTPKADAIVSASSWQAGRIIDDGIFYNNNAMSVAEIQSFLNSKVPSCDTNGTQRYNTSMTNAQYAATQGWPGPPYVCLKDYYQVPRSDQNINNLTTNAIPVGAISAAQIVKNAADAYGVSPKVLLVTLQKESLNLIGDNWPLPNQYRNAMGYGCPDTAPCDPQYEGFYNQMTNAARQFKLYRDNPTSYRYKPDQNNVISYQANAPSCGSSSVYITSKATAGLYNYTPYQPNQAALNNMYGTGDSCSAYGNRNFFRYYNDMFGSTRLPTVFKVANDTSIYVQATGYKFYVPTTSLLEDYGLPNGAQIVASSDAETIPLGNTGGLSSTISNIVKSPSTSDEDGGAIYLVSAGKRYLFRTAQQISDFGFDINDAAILPYNFIASILDGGVLSNYIKTSSSPIDVFQVSSGTKRLVLDLQTLNRLNTDNIISQVNTSISDKLLSGVPLSDNPTLIALPSGAFYLLTSGSYYYVPTPETLGCWNFIGIQVNSFRITRLSDIEVVDPTGTLSCVIKSDSSNAYIIDGGNRIQIPVSYGISSIPQSPADIITLSGRFAVRQMPLRQSVQEDGSFTVWYIEDGMKKFIPTPSDLQMLGVSAQGIDRIPKGSLQVFNQIGVKFGLGQVVRSVSDGAVYLISSHNTKRYITTPDDYVSYGYSWSALQTSDSSIMDQLYPTEQNKLSQYMYTSSGGIYLMDPYGCYGMRPSDVSAYGAPNSLAQSGQSYSSTIFPYINLAKCSYISIYVKSPGDPAVYMVSGGQRHVFTSWTTLQRVSQQANPTIITLSVKNLTAIPLGTPVAN